MTAVHQLVPSLQPGDATTAHTLEVQRLLRDLGYDSEVYVLAVHPALSQRARLVERWAGPQARDQFVLYQYAAVSGLADRALGGCPLALNYHNVTPPELFRPWDRDIALSMQAARLQLSQMAPRLSLGVCVSPFNATDLGRSGVRHRVVAPVLVDVTAFDDEPDCALLDSLARHRDAGAVNWLFVGGLAPHKAQHRLVHALAVYRATYDPRARLSLVGRVVAPGYAAALRALVDRLGLTDAVDLPGAVSHAELVAHYRSADVFVSLSVHEGFCVPVLEAMHHGVPVVALGAGAVPDTVGDGALVLDQSNPAGVAAAVHRVMHDSSLRDVLTRAGHGRVAHFSLARTRDRMGTVVRQWVSAGGAWPAADPVTEDPMAEPAGAVA